MHRLFARLFMITALFFIGVTALAQNAVKVEMADAMRANGKIYVVVAVCVTILTGLFIYVFLLDRKMTRFEKNKE